MGIFADALKKKKVKTGVSVNALPGSTHKDDTENIPQNVEKAK